MPTRKTSSGENPSELEGPPPGFLAELAAAFHRHRPQGSARWNFSVAFTRLDERFGEAARHRASEAAAPVDAEAADGAPPPADGPAGWRLAHRLADRADRAVGGRLRPLLAVPGVAPGGRAVDDGAHEGAPAEVAEGLTTTVEALRFLGARVEWLETARDRRRAAVDGPAWLLPPPSLGPWVAPVVARLRAVAPPGPVLVGECGDGELAAALVAAGLAVRGVEPRGAVAWRAAERGVEVEVGEVADLLGRRPGVLGGAVLAGVVDRLALDELLALVSQVTERLAAGAPLVVVGSDPATVAGTPAAGGWPPPALDLLPGRPLHADTWELLFSRTGYVDVGRLSPGPDGAPGSYAVAGRRPGVNGGPA